VAVFSNPERFLESLLLGVDMGDAERADGSYPHAPSGSPSTIVPGLEMSAPLPAAVRRKSILLQRDVEHAETASTGRRRDFTRSEHASGHRIFKLTAVDFANFPIIGYSLTSETGPAKQSLWICNL